MGCTDDQQALCWESATLEGPPGQIRIPLGVGELIGLHLPLPADLDSSSADRGTCYDVTLTGAVKSERFELEASLCYGERIPSR